MRTTIVLDDDLLAKAQALTSLHEKSSLESGQRRRNSGFTPRLWSRFC